MLFVVFFLLFLFFTCTPILTDPTLITVLALFVCVFIKLFFYQLNTLGYCFLHEMGYIYINLPLPLLEF